MRAMYCTITVEQLRTLKIQYEQVVGNAVNEQFRMLCKNCWTIEKGIEEQLRTVYRNS